MQGITDLSRGIDDTMQGKPHQAAAPARVKPAHLCRVGWPPQTRCAIKAA